MPQIPLYQSQTLPQGIISASPSTSGRLAGESLRGVASTVSALSATATRAVQMENEKEAQDARVSEERRMQDLRDEGQLLAMSKASEFELQTNNTVRSRMLDMSDAGVLPKWLPQDFVKDAMVDADVTATELEKTNQYAARQFRQMAEHISTQGAMQIDNALEARRKSYVAKSVSDGIVNDAKVIAGSEDPQRAFARTYGSWSAALRARQAPGAVGAVDNRLYFDDRDALSEDARKTLSFTTEQADLDRLGGAAYLRLRGFDEDGNPITSHRVPKPGVPSVAGGKWDRSIAAAADETGVDPALLDSVMHAESRGNAKVAVSPKGAIGLMQLLPGTAAEMGVDPNDPDQNVLGGARYLAMLLKRYGGDTKLAVAAYNAGMKNVDKAGGVPNFKETKKYVESVLSRYDSLSAEVQGGPVVKPAAWDAMTPDEQVRWRGVAVRQAQQDIAKDGETLRTWFQNAEALAKTGNVPQGAPTSKQCIRIYGADRGMQMWQQGQTLVRLGQNMANLADASDVDMMARLKSMKPDSADQSTYAVKNAAYSDLEGAIQATQNARQREPVDWALLHNPSCVKAANALRSSTDANRPQLTKAYAASLVAAQSRYGISSPQLMSKQQASDLVANLTDPAGFEFVGDRVAKLQKEWGAYWPSVHQQVAKDLPPALDVIASGLPRQTSALVAKLSQVKVEDMRKGIDPVDRKDVQLGVSAGMDLFSRSLVSQDPGAGREKAVGFGTEAEKLALHYVSQGMSPGAAAKKATTDLVGKYRFVEQSGFLRTEDGRTQIVPVYRVPAERDVDVVKKGADRLRMAVHPSDLLPPLGMSPGEWASYVNSNGYWVDAPNEDGLELHVGGDAVTRSNGAPIRVSWAACEEASKPAYIARMRRTSSAPPSPPTVPKVSSPIDAARSAPLPRSPYMQDPMANPAQPFPGVSFP